MRWPFFSEFADHHRQPLPLAWMPGQEISRGKQKALKRFGARSNVANELRILRDGQKFVGGHQLLCFKVVGDVKDSLALRGR